MKTILCPTDFSPVAQNAHLFAAEFGKKSGAEVILFHTEFFPQPVGQEDEELVSLPAEYIAELKEKLESIIAQLKTTYPGVRFSYVVEEGLVAENIALYANSNNIDFIIIGTSGASGIEALFAGSNTVKVMESTKCPILIIPRKVKHTSPSLFVYATDLQEDNEKIVNEILEITRIFNAELQLLHIRNEEGLELVNSEASLNTILKMHSNENVRQKVITVDDSVKEIEEYAKNKADILIMTFKKNSFLDKLFKRNRTEKIAYDAQIPLLILHKS